ncbi:cell division transporter, ATP-binding protein FtsE [Lachnospiraceae bacterium KM106-2]|nr:cell division transporter, ATP-binding protein FtsE [Lachnospiraceae bacterium KM106-2]
MMVKNKMIETNLLCKSFIYDGEINNVIKNLDLTVYDGDFTVICGASGSGKSTLLYSLSGMDAVTTGKVVLNGQDITKCKEKTLAKIRKEKIGFVFQGINLIDNLTVYENILSPSYKTGRNKAQLENEVDEYLDKMGLKDHKKKFPNQLSGGQRQRVAIIRALINHPDVIFADEPTGALNSSQGQDVLDIFSKIHKEGQTIVMVTHDIKAATRGNRVIYLKDGRIDGELNLCDYYEDDPKKREETVYHFLQEKGW